MKIGCHVNMFFLKTKKALFTKEKWMHHAAAVEKSTSDWVSIYL